jgi:perosamine synthetase
MRNIPFHKASIGAEEIDAVTTTLKSGWLTTGPTTRQFEREFGNYLHHKHALAVNSCTAALHLALEAIGLQAGQAVIVPTLTFAATAEVIRYFGARPILVDCRWEDFNLDIADAEQRIQLALAAGQVIAAIMPVHYGGQIGDVAGVQTLAQRYHLKVVEDAAHCCPAFYRDYGTTRPPDYRTAEPEVGGRKSEDRGPKSEVSGPSSVVSSPGGPWLPVGTGADISCYSFYANKAITTGEGGMACTANEAYADRMRLMSLHGLSRDAWQRYTALGSWYYEIIAPGFKYNLTDLAAAIGLQQLHKADRLHRRRAELAMLYQEFLQEVEEIILPRVQSNRIHSWHLYVIRLRLERLKLDRAQFIQELRQRGIGTSVHWLPLHMHPYYRQTYGYQPQDLPVAGALYPQLITLPIYPDLTADEVEYVCRSIKDIIAPNRRSGLCCTVKGFEPGNEPGLRPRSHECIPANY